MKAYAMIAADLFAVLAVTFMVSLGVLAPLVQNEVLTFMESTKTKKSSDSLAPDSTETGLLEIFFIADQQVRYQLKLPGKTSVNINDYQKMLHRLEIEQPQALRLRVDRRVESGVFQDLILDANQLDIQIWQVSDGR